MDIHGLSADPMGGDGWKSCSGIQCRCPWISVDCPCTPRGGGGRWLLGNPWTIKRGCIRTYRDNQENVCSQISVSTYTERRSFKLIQWLQCCHCSQVVSHPGPGLDPGRGPGGARAPPPPNPQNQFENGANFLCSNLKIVIFYHLMLVDAIVMIMSQFQGAQTWLWT